MGLAPPQRSSGDTNFDVEPYLCSQLDAVKDDTQAIEVMRPS